MSSCYSEGKTEAQRDEVTDLKVYHWAEIKPKQEQSQTRNPETFGRLPEGAKGTREGKDLCCPVGLPCLLPAIPHSHLIFLTPLFS